MNERPSIDHELDAEITALEQNIRLSPPPAERAKMPTRRRTTMFAYALGFLGIGLGTTGGTLCVLAGRGIYVRPIGDAVTAIAGPGVWSPECYAAIWAIISVLALVFVVFIRVERQRGLRRNLGGMSALLAVVLMILITIALGVILVLMVQGFLTP